MIHDLTYSTSILDTLGVLSLFSFADTIWTKYEMYAIPKIEDTTLKLRGSLYYVKNLTPDQAKEELNSLNQFIQILYDFWDVLESVNDNKIENFKSTALEFFGVVDQLQDNLEDVAQIHSSYEMSIPVLANDWDRKEDDHWNNY